MSSGPCWSLGCGHMASCSGPSAGVARCQAVCVPWLCRVCMGCMAPLQWNKWLRCVDKCNTNCCHPSCLPHHHIGTTSVNNLIWVHTDIRQQTDCSVMCTQTSVGVAIQMTRLFLHGCAVIQLCQHTHAVLCTLWTEKKRGSTFDVITLEKHTRFL